MKDHLVIKIKEALEMEMATGIGVVVMEMVVAMEIL